MNKKKRQFAYSRGHKAEYMACWILRLKGYRILATRYKTPVGEVDIIARKRNTVIFAEVKARQNLEGALESVTPHMRYRIGRAATFFISAYPVYACCDLRFDLFAIQPPFFWRHLDNAWRPSA